MFGLILKIIIFLSILERKVEAKQRHVGVLYYQFSNYPNLVLNDDNSCSRYDASYQSTSFKTNTRRCKCGYKEIFFARKEEQPKCQGDDYGRLYGCHCTDPYCTLTLSKQLKILARWTFRNRYCPHGTSRFNVQLWDSDGFKITKLSRRFRLTSDVGSIPGSTVLELYWKTPYESYTIFEGRLIKFDITCDNGRHHECFVMKGIGSHIHTFDTSIAHNLRSLRLFDMLKVIIFGACLVHYAVL